MQCWPENTVRFLCDFLITNGFVIKRSNTVVIKSLGWPCESSLRRYLEFKKLDSVNPQESGPEEIQ